MPKTERPYGTRGLVPPAATGMTAAELLEYHDPYDRRTELVRGRLLVSEPPGHEHGRVALLIGAELLLHVRARSAGTGEPAGSVALGGPGCWIERDPDTVRAPDVCYIAPERMPGDRVFGFLECPPTLAVEVLSPSDRPGAVRAKVAQWLAAGTALVWVVDPRRRTARVHRADGTCTAIAADGALDGEAVLPGFVLPLATVFG